MVEDEGASGVDPPELLDQGDQTAGVERTSRTDRLPGVDQSSREIIVRLLAFFGMTLLFVLAFSVPAMLVAEWLAQLDGVEIDWKEMAQRVDDAYLIPLFYATALAPFVQTWRTVRGKRLSWWEAGFRRRNLIGDLFVGLVIGAGSFAIVPVLAAAFGWVEIEYAPAGDAYWGTLPVAFHLLLVAAAAEEFVLRGVPLALIARRNLPLAILVTSFIFSILHAPNAGFNWVALLEIMAAGIVLAIARLRSGALWLPIGWHLGWNLSQGWLFGCVVSGHEASTAPLLATYFSGPEVLTGGEFGPEAGLFSVVAEVVTFYFYMHLVPGRIHDWYRSGTVPGYSREGGGKMMPR